MKTLIISLLALLAICLGILFRFAMTAIQVAVCAAVAVYVLRLLGVNV